MTKYNSSFLKNSTVSEPLAVYSKRTKFLNDPIYSGIDTNYLKNLQFDELLQNKTLLLQLVRTGISTSLFKAIVKDSPFELSEWVQYLDIPLRTIQRYIKDNKLLKPIYSEKVIEFTELIQQGLETFDSADIFKKWLCTPSFVFSGQRPCDLLSNTIGIRMVSEEIVNIEHGIFL